jgi:hypothetical protein
VPDSTAFLKLVVLENERMDFSPLLSRLQFLDIIDEMNVCYIFLHHSISQSCGQSILFNSTNQVWVASGDSEVFEVK